MVRTKVCVRLASTVLATAVLTSLAACSNPLSRIGDALGTPSVTEALSQQAQQGAQTASTPSSLVTAGTLTVGIDSSSSAPMGIQDVDGSYEGFDVDMAAAIASEMGLDVTYVSVANASRELGSTCDVVMGVKSGDASGLTVVGSYAESAAGFFHKGDATTVKLSDVTGKNVGVQDGSASQQMLKRSNVNATAKTYANLNAAFEGLEAGEVDYVLCDAFSGAYLAGGYGDISFAGSIEVPSSVGVAVASGDAELQTSVKQAVDKVSSGGVGALLRSKWLGGLPTLTDSSVIEGVVVSSAAATKGSQDTVSGAAGAQDGSNAGANAVDISD